MKFIDVQRFKLCFTAITEQRFYFQQMFSCTSAYHRIGTTGIIANHAADHRPVGSGSFGPKEQTMRFQKHVQFITDHAGLHPHPFLFRIQFDDLCKIFGYIYDNTIAHYLSCQWGTRRSGYQRCFFCAGKMNEFFNIVNWPRHGYRQRHLPVGRGIGGI